MSQQMTETKPLLGWYDGLGTPLERAAIITVHPTMGTFCAYVGIPENHALAHLYYEEIPLDCHGGLTYGTPGREGTHWLPGWYWYGWDYNHWSDYCPLMATYGQDGGHRWTLEEVRQETQDVLDQLGRLMEETL